MITEIVETDASVEILTYAYLHLVMEIVKMQEIVGKTAGVLMGDAYPAIL